MVWLWWRVTQGGDELLGCGEHEQAPVESTVGRECGVEAVEAGLVRQYPEDAGKDVVFGLGVTGAAVVLVGVTFAHQDRDGFGAQVDLDIPVIVIDRARDRGHNIWLKN